MKKRKKKAKKEKEEEVGAYGFLRSGDWISSFSSKPRSGVLRLLLLLTLGPVLGPTLAAVLLRARSLLLM